MSYRPIDKLTQRAKRTLLETRRKSVSSDLIIASDLILSLKTQRGIAAQIIPKIRIKVRKNKKISLAKVLQGAFFEAREMGHPYVGTEHLLLSLLKLLKKDTTLKKVRKIISKIVTYPKTAAPSPFKSKALSAFSTDLTYLAGEGKLPKIIGRDDEIGKIIRILLRAKKNFPLIVGDRGIGKTSLVLGLAQRISEMKVPPKLLGARVILIDLPSFMLASSIRLDFDSGISELFSEIGSGEKNILFVDDFHLLFNPGFHLTSQSFFASLFKASYEMRGLRIIGCGRAEALHGDLIGEGQFRDFFEKVEVGELGEETVSEILEKEKSHLEQYHNVVFTPEALDLSLALAKNYIADPAFPKKGINLLDDIASFSNVYFKKEGKVLARKRTNLEKCKQSLKKAVNRRDLERAVLIKNKIQSLERDMLKLQDESPKSPVKITPSYVSQVVSDITGIPVGELIGEEKSLYKDLEKILSESIIGQDAAIAEISKALKRSRAGLSNLKRPTGSFLFLGPTGVGKTETAKVLANTLFSRNLKAGASQESGEISKGDVRFLRLDMSDFRERHTVARLVGSPPGYIGYDEGGELTDFVSRNPYSVILFDEIEKAHLDVLNILLSIMEEGELKDAKGKITDFSNTVVILTSNLGADLIRRGEFGYGVDTNGTEGLKTGAGGPNLEEDNQVSVAPPQISAEYEHMREVLLSNLKLAMKPEFLNRLDAVVVYRNLDKKDLLRICDLLLNPIINRLAERKIKLTVLKSAKRFLVEKGWSDEYGARHLRRVIEKYITDKVAVMILEDTLKFGGRIKVKEEGGELIFSIY